MDFLRARTTEQIKTRQEEIMKACYTLFQEKGYAGVSLKGISEITSISRSSIYNYYDTKDEILLDILKLELLEWNSELLSFQKDYTNLNKEEFSKLLTENLLNKEMMLKLYSFLFSLLEINCRLEKIVEFKQTAIPIVGTLASTITYYFPEYNLEKANLMTEQILSYVLGLFPMSHLTNKQREAIALSNTGYKEPNFRELCYSGILAFLDNAS